MTRLSRLGALVALVWLFHTGPARAAFHLMMVVEVFPGYAASPNAQYVELQMYSPGQNFVAGHSVQVFNAAGTAVGTFTFPGNLPNGADQAHILVATAEAQTLFGVTPDLIMTPAISASGGKVCFDGPTPPDCVAWGNYSGSATGVGNPFSPGGLSLGQAAQRRLDRGIPGVLDYPADDTNDSATDFVAAAPTPRPRRARRRLRSRRLRSIAFGDRRRLRLAGARPVGDTLVNPGDFSVDTTFPLDILDGAAARTVQLGCTPQAEGARTATLTLSTNDPTRPTVAYDLTCTGLPAPPSLSFFTVNPCRVVDTRLGGGPLVAGTDRTFTMVSGACGVPAGAKAVSINVTVTQPTGPGNLRLFPAGGAVPTASAINYTAGQTRANNAIIGLSAAGELTAHCQSSGSTHLILDVNGYFAE